MKQMLLILLVLAGSASSLAAQTITGTQATITNTTTGVSTTVTLAPTAIACGVTPKLLSGTVNPTKLAWNDSTNALNDCVYTDPGNGPLLTLPIGTASYTATTTSMSAAGNSPPSLPTLPFTRPGLPPGAPQGLRTAP